ncbi:hypothetical protein B0H13DRAFT_2318927 [Mycena leptocephala]|nr:hypothetical protein B0H13DRAFT_2318927 [Mycena leptocephala]
MFGNGYRIHNSHFYNVGGDVNLETHHNLTIMNHEPHHLAFQSPSGARLGFEDNRATVSHQHLIHDYEPYEGAFPPSTLGLDEAGGSQRERAGVARNSHHGMTARSAPYDIASHSRRSNMRTNEVQALEQASSNSDASIWSSGGLAGTVHTPEFNYPSSESSLSSPLYTNLDSQIPYPQPRYPVNPHSNGTTTLGDFSTEWDENYGTIEYPYHDLSLPLPFPTTRPSLWMRSTGMRTILSHTGNPPPARVPHNPSTAEHFSLRIMSLTRNVSIIITITGRQE